MFTRILSIQRQLDELKEPVSQASVKLSYLRTKLIEQRSLKFNDLKNFVQIKKTLEQADDTLELTLSELEQLREAKLTDEEQHCLNRAFATHTQRTKLLIAQSEIYKAIHNEYYNEIRLFKKSSAPRMSPSYLPNGYGADSDSDYETTTSRSKSPASSPYLS